MLLAWPTSLKTTSWIRIHNVKETKLTAELIINVASVIVKEKVIKLVNCIMVHCYYIAILK